MSPAKISIEDNTKLKIIWNDNSASLIKLANLRKQCPCAICASENENQSNSYIPIYTSEQLGVTKIEVVGNYAIHISWADGHNTGMYEFSQLKNLEQ